MVLEYFTKGAHMYIEVCHIISCIYCTGILPTTCLSVSVFFLGEAVRRDLRRRRRDAARIYIRTYISKGVVTNYCCVAVWFVVSAPKIAHISSTHTYTHKGATDIL